MNFEAPDHSRGPAQKPTRREFLVSSATALLCLKPSVCGAFESSCSLPLGVRPLETLSLRAFAACQLTRFRVSDAPGRHEGLVLISAKPDAFSLHRSMNDPDAAHERFSLLFEAGAGVVLQDGICRFEHPELGLFDLFIQRVGPPGGASLCYQAVFNRPAPVVPSAPRTVSIG